MSEKERTQKDKFIRLLRMLLNEFEKKELVSYEAMDWLTECPGRDKMKAIVYEKVVYKKVEIVFR